MRLVYTLIFYLALPLVILRLLWRARSAPAYSERWAERFGFFNKPEGDKTIWVHAVSVGETLAALPMMRQLQQRYPDHQLIVTTMTPTGSERVRAALGDSVFHVYAPYDLPDAVGRFLSRVQPELAIIMETELWPNTLRGCRQRNIPVLIANARLSEKSAKGYKRFAGLSRELMGYISRIAVQNQADAERFGWIGARESQLNVTGSIKFDIDVSPQNKDRAADYARRWKGQSERPILLAASTHEGEDELLLQAHQALLQQRPDLLLVLVPRHPERFDRVADMAARDFEVQRHSAAEPVALSSQVLIGDTMGEMMALLGACDICFMGGSWVDSGGHNLIEPAVWGKPQFTGPSLFNFAEVSGLLIEAGGVAVVADPQALVEGVIRLLDHPDQARQMGQAASQVAEKNKGALQRLLNIIDELLTASDSN
ncbi:MAG: lipid IV(A) 3-deoxy-D-manno-octulosonic acid transferase [Candidatus Pelagadaptatus aseana]|uniref:lipid IV(A) 3-deoxy-D-manno-octulosonic acid transferase n=1 Tax=Candidatus Pelagadaptatus aseana TaxID=3120508 RepID=UPI0039B1C962